MKTLIFLSVIVLGLITFNSLYTTAVDPEISSKLAVAQVNGTAPEAVAVRTYQHGESIKDIINFIGLVVVGMLLGKILGKWMKGESIFSLILLIFLFNLTGCWRSYEEPVYDLVDNNETAFVIPLEGDTTDQAKFASAEHLEQFKVATKRIRITRRWNQTGFRDWNGEWIPTVRVIKVNRTPIARQWASDKPGSGNGIWVESSDSVGFSTGFAVVAAVEERDTALFLYSYRDQNLELVMDGEIRARVQSIVASVAARYIMDDLRNKKEEMTQAIKADIIPFFKAKGITISTIGNFGGFTYENPKIQESIDSVFIAQQLKNTAAAQLAAQKDLNKKLQEEGEGEASKVREIAKGNADAVVTEATAKAEAISLVAKASQEAASNPVFLQLKMMEVQLKGLERWQGYYPNYMVTMGNQANPPVMLLQMPQPIISSK